MYQSINEEMNREDSAKRFIEALLIDYIDQPDIYLSAAEAQYILVKIREKSVSDTFIFGDDCSECLTLNQINASITEKLFVYSKYLSSNR